MKNWEKEREVLKIHHHVFLPLHSTIFCITIGFRHQNRNKGNRTILFTGASVNSIKRTSAGTRYGMRAVTVCSLVNVKCEEMRK